MSNLVFTMFLEVGVLRACVRVELGRRCRRGRNVRLVRVLVGMGRMGSILLLGCRGETCVASVGIIKPLLIFNFNGLYL